ncbi:MAG TPA: 50S ribosomal protein L2 [Planctomycetota bacterium]|nr:50S ribosomal protein L2 [Planctomycetota bacterium]HUV37998.1 50S ribosomal protein L2 [Planctomycetota bacterium]
MPVVEYRPTTPGRRGMSKIDTSELAKKPTVKKLLQRVTRKGGRNFSGKTTVRYVGGGHRKLYRKIDFRRDKDDIPARVAAIEYDPNRTCHVALLFYADGEKRYILAPAGLKVDDTVRSGERVDPDVGACMPLSSIPPGMEIHNIELRPGQGGQMVRSAGGAAVLSAREGEWAIVILPSGETRRVKAACRATIGRVGNVDHSGVSIGKAGRKRWMGIRPHVRGTAKNPVAHPMGGGEGRRAGGRHPCSRTGVLSKGGRTRKRNKGSNKFILRHRKRGRFQP